MLEEYELLNDALEKRNEELNKEIEGLEKENERYRRAINEMATNISKAIEYIEDKYAVILADDLFLDHDERIERKRLLEIIGILDKENI